ncbi:MAG: hypothetical protein GF372_05130 [Candidatus Marinimicrobia bacterium]|nr:hypothetical protein [Candidatus Neomarinimicrobiota bacterium]
MASLKIRIEKLIPFSVIFLLWLILLILSGPIRAFASQPVSSQDPFVAPPPFHESQYSESPITLGLYPSQSLKIGFGLLPLLPFPGIEIDNNAVSPHWYNKKLIQKNFLRTADKNELLAFFPEGGWDIYPSFGLPVGSITKGNYSLGLSIQGTGEVSIPKSLLHFAFFGNRFNQPVDIRHLNAEGMMSAVVEFTHGRSIESKLLKNAAHGMSFKLINGISHFRVDNAIAQVSSYIDSINIAGSYQTIRTPFGLGYAMDYEFGFQPTTSTYFRIAIENLFGKVYWYGNRSITREYDYLLNLIDVDLFETDTDSLFEHSVRRDELVKKGGFFTDFPGRFTAEVQFKETPNRIIYLQYLQGFSDRYHASRNPKFSLVSVNYLTQWLPISLMFAVGGKQGYQWGTSFQLLFNRYQLNIAFSQSGGFFNYAKGFRLFVSQSIKF